MRWFPILLVLTACESGAPTEEGDDCPIAVPSTATVVTGDESSNAEAGAYYVCDGGRITNNATGSDVYVTPGGSAVINASNANVWVQDDGEVVVNVAATGVRVTASANASVTVNGGTIDRTDCDTVTFANAPACP